MHKIKTTARIKQALLLIPLLLTISCSTMASIKYNLDTKSRNIAAQSNKLRPSVVRMGLEVFYNSKNLGVATKKAIITVIDYSLPSSEKRLWVVDIQREKILHTSLVAHGKHSGENYTKNFSNKIGSLQTSIGVFLTENTYFGRDGYSLKIQGLEKGFNDKAKIRTIVLHGAPYVSKEFVKVAGRTGRSWGCPAVEKPLAKPIIDTIKGGSIILAFYPDKTWLNNSKFINGQA